MRVQIEFTAEIEPDFLDELRRIVDHHIEYLVDLDGNTEIISIENAGLSILDDETEI